MFEFLHLYLEFVFQNVACGLGFAGHVFMKCPARRTYQALELIVLISVYIYIYIFNN